MARTGGRHLVRSPAASPSAAFSPYALCALFDAVTQALNAFFFAAVLRGSGNSMLQAAFDRFLFAVALVGLPASVASLVAAVAASVHLVR